MRWLPESARRLPDRTVRFAYQVPAAAPPQDPERTVAEALRATSLAADGTAASGWKVSLPHRTWVYGVIRREVDEEVALRLDRRHDTWQLSLSCLPVQSHAAHAAGVAGVIVLAAAAWVAGGAWAGLLPAVTTTAAGVLVVEVTRQWALTALERRLRRLVGDIGSALWPDAPAQITDCSGPRRD